MEATIKKYPELFRKLKSRINYLIKKHGIKLSKKKYRSNIGSAWADEKKIKIPIIKDIESVYVILHEIAHVVYDHGENSTKRLYLEEMEAEVFALNFLKKWNIQRNFPEDYNKIRNRAQRYIRWNILHTIQKTYSEEKEVLLLENVHVRALRFSKLNKFKIKLVRKSTKRNKK